MNTNFLKIFILITAFFVSVSAVAFSPLGQWVTYDLDNTPRTIVEIYETGDSLSGKVIKELNPEKGTVYEPLCTQCDGDKKDKPKLGMVVLWGLKSKGNNKWVNGTILDPETGKTYGSRITMDIEDELNLRAYAGIPLFGKTIVWKRASKE